MGQGWSWVSVGPAAGGREKVPEGAAACLSREQDGSGSKAGEAGPLCCWEGEPVMVTPQQSQSERTLAPPRNTHTVLSSLGPSLLRRHPLLFEEGTCPSSAFPGSEETFASCLHLFQPHGPLAGPTSLVFPALRPWTRSWLCFPGCLSLSGPSRVTGIVGESLSVECRYQEEFIDDNKFWCTSLCLWKTVETRESAREVRRGRVSIRDLQASPSQ